MTALCQFYVDREIRYFAVMRGMTTPAGGYRRPAPPREVLVGPFPPNTGLLVPAIALSAIGAVLAVLAIVGIGGVVIGAAGASAGAYIGLGVTLALSISLFLTAAPHFEGARRRARAIRIRVTARSLEVERANGRVKVVPRVPAEQARVARVPKGRGGPPTACLAYGDHQTEMVLLELFTTNGVVELAPAVDQLSAALAEVPRA